VVAYTILPLVSSEIGGILLRKKGTKKWGFCPFLYG
jgi:hypothetical protein